MPVLWPPVAQAGNVLRPEISPFLENFFVDAAACWEMGPAHRVNSGPWLESDTAGHEHHLQAAAFTVGGRATLLIEEVSSTYKERWSILQKAHEAALAYEQLQRAEQALAEEKRLLEERVQERTAQLFQSNATLQEEVATRRSYAERLEGIHEIDKAILATRSPEAIADVALQRLHHLLPFDQAIVVELNHDEGNATVLTGFPQNERSKVSGLQVSAEQLQQLFVLESGQIFRLTEPPEFLSGHDSEEANGNHNWALVLCLPLVADETTIGALVLAMDSPDEFTPEREKIAVEVGSQLAVALQQARLFAQVSAGREQLRALSFRLVEVQEAERRFVACELHDEIGQALTGLKLSLEMSRGQPPTKSDSGLSEALAMLDELTRRVRQLSLDLRPPVLDDLGLLPAMDWLIQRFFKQTGIRVDLRHTCFEKRLPISLEAAAFRIVQEALTNVARHAAVKKATVRLWSDGEYLGVQVEDKGVGFNSERVRATRSSCGLSGMRERAVLLGGRFTVDSASGSGTRVTVELPINAPDATPTTKSERLA